jgi:DNA (cytosine-5)-methyltransferase 1
MLTLLNVAFSHHVWAWISTDYSRQGDLKLTVIDLFCGCGGISLGFQMAGFKIIYGLDNNKDSIETFERNFPTAKICCSNIENVEIDSIPSSDIIVGGPPCVNFSTSKGSRANVLDGLKLVQFFLKIVYIKKPKYWIMENVPRIGLHLPERIPLKWIGIDREGFLDIPNKKEFDISLYGAPQKRKRLLIGKYPIAEPTHAKSYKSSLLKNFAKSAKTLGEIINSFPDPLGVPQSKVVKDPNYSIEILETELTDHFMDTVITDQEARQIAQVKQNHPYMGKMDFPDDLDKPARTVVSLQMGRETLVIKSKNINYRRATIRECATLQTFPINFQFGGKTVNSRYKQAGNAVPPILTWHIANGIMLAETNEQCCPFIINNVATFDPPQARKRSIRKTNYSSSRIIRIPHKEVRGTRIEIVSSNYPETIWRSCLHLGEGKNDHKILHYTLNDAMIMAQESIKNLDDNNMLLSKFNELIIEFENLKFENAHELHKYIHDNKEYPDSIHHLSNLLESFFPASQFSKYDIHLRKKMPGIEKNKLRIRIVIATVLLKKLEMALSC